MKLQIKSKSFLIPGSLGFLFLSLILTDLLPSWWTASNSSKDIFNSLHILVLGGFLLSFGGLVFCLRKSLSNRIETSSINSWMNLFLLLLSSTLLCIYLWPFDLDDKWIYYRISRNVLETGLPLWNANDPLFVGASFFYPYLLSPGHYFGDWQAWEIYQKCFGFLTHIGCVVLVYWHFRSTKLAILVTSGVALFAPAILWSLGGLDVTFATFWLLVCIFLYFRYPNSNYLFWWFCGCLMWIRPDAILVGIGTWLAQFLRNPFDWRGSTLKGLSFSIPILIYVGFNQIKTNLPLPTVFYCKGWNKTFSGKYPLYFDAYIGSLHLISGILTNLTIAFLVLLILINIISFCKNDKFKVLWKNQDARFNCNFNLILGLIFYLGYHVIGGYQHMNFTFRYWLPGIIALSVVSADMFKNNFEFKGKELLSHLTSSKTLCILQITLFFQALAVSFYIKNINITPTIAKLRDQFSVIAYANYLKSWMDAGIYLREKVKTEDRIFLFAGMASGAFTKAYLVDQFYFPPHLSKFQDLRATLPQPPKGENTMANYDYILINNPDQKSIVTHQVEKEYENIIILKRKDLGDPVTPKNIHVQKVNSNLIRINWTSNWKNLGYKIYLQKKEIIKQIGTSYAGSSSFTIAKESIQEGDKLFIKAFNNKGDSEPSGKIEYY